MQPRTTLPSQGDLAERDALSLLEEVYLAEATGALKLERSPHREELFFVHGELYLRPQHPLASRLKALIGAPARSAPATAFVDTLVSRLGGWTAGRFAFESGIRQISSDLVGPMPLTAVLMEAAVRTPDEGELLSRVGGENRKLVARDYGDSLRIPEELDPQEVFLLSRLERPASLKELLGQVDMERRTVVEKLCRLLAIGLVRHHDRQAVAEGGRVLTRDHLDRFLGRVRESLERTPLKLDPETHRRRLAEVMARLGGADHFELLGVAAGASEDAVYAGYLELARLVHPSQAAALGMHGREATLRLLFERATDAYLTLSDPDRRREYQLIAGARSEAVGSVPSGEVRAEEEEEVAERHFRLARDLVHREDFHYAIELLQQAVRIRPKAAYYKLLGDCQAHNPRWVSKAIGSYSQAVELEPDDPGLRTALAETLEHQGHYHRARAEYEAVLERMPAHPEAIEGLERIAAARSRPHRALARKGALRRLRDQLRRWTTR